MIEEALNILRQAQAEYKPAATIGLISGGRDSVTTLHVTRSLLTHAAHIVTGIGIPQTTEFVEGLCQQWEMPLVKLITPPEVYRAIVFAKSESGEVHGFPGPAGHNVCYWHLKQQRLRELRAMFVTNGRKQRVIFVTGIRLDESTRRMRKNLSIPVRREGSTVWVSPLLHWTNEYMLEYRQANPDIPINPVSELLHRSGECLCGAFAKSHELAELQMWYPEVAKYITDMEEELSKLPVRCPKWGGQGREGKVSMQPLCVSCGNE